MRLMTCTGCKLAGNCGHAAFLRKALRGYGIRSMKFACALREEIFRPGQAALFTTFVSDEDDEYRRSVTEVTYPGYVLKQMGSKVLGYIKPGAGEVSGEEIPFEPKANGFVKMPLSRVKPDDQRDDADVTACRWCARHIGLGEACERDPHYTPLSQCRAGQCATLAKPTPSQEEVGR
jgi:hypothetical protein